MVIFLLKLLEVLKVRKKEFRQRRGLSKRASIAQEYRDKFSWYSCGFWNMNNMSNSQVIRVGRMLSEREKSGEES